MKKEPTIAQLVDELGPLQEQVSAAKVAEKRAKALKERITALADKEVGKDKATIYTGELYECPVGPRRPERVVKSLGKLFAFLGKAKFLAISKGVFLEELDKLLPAEKHDEFLATDNTGYREIKTVRKMQPAKAA